MSGHNLPPSELTWIGSDQLLAKRFARPVRDFIEADAAGGVVLVLATIVALIWANSPWSDTYHQILDLHLEIDFGSLHILDESVEHLINDGLMAIFFFVIGMEIKTELVTGELNNVRAATLPTVAALGGMIVPAGLYFLLNTSSPESAGWGIPMATDIAFALGIMSLLGNRVPSALKLFLLALAIVDDVGAIAVIAIFYTSEINIAWGLAAIGLLIVIVVLKQMRVWYTPVYVILGTVIWYAVLESGVHATIAGVALGLLAPATPLQTKIKPEMVVGNFVDPNHINPATARRANMYVRESVSVADRLQTLIHPFTSFVILPLFALANAGIALSGDSVSAATTSTVTLGIIVGLLVGKTGGIALFSFVAVKAGICELPRGVTWPQVVAMSLLAGIGFTVALFITGLAFEGAELELLDTQARMGILFASLIASVVGLGALAATTKSPESSGSDTNSELHPVEV